MKGPQRIALVLTLAGLLALFLGFLWQESQFVVGVMINLGTGLLLFAGLSLVLENYLAKQQAREAQLVRDVEERVRTSLETIGEQTREVLRARHIADEGALDSFAQDLSFKTALILLERAERLGCITSEGIRVAIPQAFPRVCFALPPPPEVGQRTIRVSLQEWDGAHVADYEWGPDEEVSVLLAEVAEELVRRDDYPGDERFDAGVIMTELRDSVAIGMHSRSGEEGVPHIGKLIEVLDDTWVLTERGLESWTREYVIPVDRLNDDDWAERIREEPWADPEGFLNALDVAVAYHSGG